VPFVVESTFKMTQSKSRELLDEFRAVFAGRNSFLNAILPPILFLLVWRLAKLQGPSVEEFKNNVPPPWQSQRRGF
jgi:hypothetical protein